MTVDDNFAISKSANKALRCLATGDYYIEIVPWNAMGVHMDLVVLDGGRDSENCRGT